MYDNSQIYSVSTIETLSTYLFSEIILAYKKYSPDMRADTIRHKPLLLTWFYNNVHDLVCGL